MKWSRHPFSTANSPTGTTVGTNVARSGPIRLLPFCDLLPKTSNGLRLSGAPRPRGRRPSKTNDNERAAESDGRRPPGRGWRRASIATRIQPDGTAVGCNSLMDRGAACESAPRADERPCLVWMLEGAGISLFHVPRRQQRRRR